MLCDVAQLVHLALQLQEQFDNDANDRPLVPWKPERPLSVVDASWETLDPTPDVRAMFLEFNDRFFWGKLSGVEVKWSPRMTLCAGVCSYEGRGGLCSIRLSEPLLKLRPRKDLVETLLHEMIHALLFVTQNNRDRDGHGPEFCKHMNRINKDSGANITVYHNFNDEVDVYRQHWWRCNGPCQTRKPYLGFVKRAMNRAPSALDPWWEDHQRTCGGTYTKVKEPDGYGKKKEAKKNKKMPAVEKPAGSRDIRDVIAFSGKGFVLGGNSSSLKMSAGPASSAVAKLVPPSPPARVFPAVTQPAPRDLKAPAKKSVANTRVFVNINGSPVKIQKPRQGVGDKNGVGGHGIGSNFAMGNGSHGVGRHSVGSGKREEPDRLKQTSINVLFNGKSTHHSFMADSPSKTKSPTQILVSPSVSDPHHNNHQATSSPPPFERPSGNAVANAPQWKKRPLNDLTGVFEGFNKRLKVETKDDTESGPTSSHAATSSSSPAMVTCPVCQASVQESKINEHLDSCLC
ncbi:DNA-dependent metalloprotease SPRTN isoform X1 [Hippocampus zosterae]|uniref:DNA-dependent metalloprotease SPRTN isoform X1 n=1 Tax=Hippocampus zosterae TaxID=109293 RepID=UPI00223E089B|nr:DNA-dependent metalloprotease SPRTN isoform X1 [Hippocampus zosterae]XP_051909242.1 DNA-dependent metalloprotease SPRTN isoform X1 [Hippocampus zosterae]